MNTLKVKVNDFPVTLEVEQEAPVEVFHVPAKPVVKDWGRKEIILYAIMKAVMGASILGYWIATYFFAAILIAVLAGSANAQDTLIKVEKVTASEVGGYTAKEPAFYVVNDLKSWAKITTVLNNGTTKYDFGKPDFANNVYVFVCAGAKPHLGYKVELAEVVRWPSKKDGRTVWNVQIQAVLSDRNPDQRVVLDNPKSPWMMFALSKTALGPAFSVDTRYRFLHKHVSYEMVDPSRP